jgi:hypothetical protein
MRQVLTALIVFGLLALFGHILAATGNQEQMAPSEPSW